MSALLKELVDRIGFTTDLDTAAKLLGYTGHKAARQAIRRGSFPVPVRRAGTVARAKLIVSTFDLAVFLSGGQVGGEPAPQPAKRTGRPRGSTKAARVAGQQAGEVSHG